MPWRLTIRDGSTVQRRTFEDRDEALAALDSQVSEVAQLAPAGALDLKVKRFEPRQQVVARIELAGPQRLFPSIRAGVDVRGDGSTEAYLGRIKRRVIDPRAGEGSSQALRRALGERTRGD